MDLFKWFRAKPAPVETRAPERSPGLFSTDVNLLSLSKTQRLNRLTEAVRSSFQITELKAVDAQGNSTGKTYAMDSAANNENGSISSYKANMGLFGSTIPEAQFLWFAQQGFISYQACAMLAQHWLIDKACTMPARDAARHGYDVTSNDGTEIKPEIFDFIRKQDHKFGIKDECVEFVRMGRIFGIRIALFLVDSTDPLYYEMPFNIDAVKPGSYRGIKQIDPYWITPELSGQAIMDPASPSFYEPTWWRVSGRRIHSSHLIIMRTGKLPDVLKPSYRYGGVSVPQRISERVYAAERTANEAPMLAMSKRLTVFNTDLTKAAANQQAFSEKMAIWSEFMNNFGIKVVGEEEAISQYDTSLADLDAVIMTQYQIVAAASEVPATKLLGTSPKGFNATGEFEEASYHEFLESIQEHDLTPLVQRHHELLIRSEIAPEFGIKPFETTVNWKPVDSPTAAELAEINSKKADTDAKNVASGAIDGYDVRQRLINDPDSGYNGIEPIVPDGPGDREAEQEAKEAALENSGDYDAKAAE